MAKKRKRYENRQHVEEVSMLRCCLSVFANARDCNGSTQAHHLLKPWDGSRGMSLRANDKNVIPLCYFHHAMLHTKLGTEANLFTKYNLKSDFGKEYAEHLFKKYEEEHL